VTTCGSVDDGKSTLIGRLLYDTGSVPSDQLEAIARASAARGQQAPDLSLLTDGLRAEREQGITIDVAYRYFGTARRRFIVADAPGHAQFTRNMATAASVADLAIVLIDARHAVTAQTRRHALIASILRVPHVVVAINKIDLVPDARGTFERVRDDALRLFPQRSPESLHVLPISALHGDNIARPSERLAWYQGPTLLSILENARADAPDAPATPPSAEHTAHATATRPLRMHVHAVIRPEPGPRAYGVVVLAGSVAPGDEVVLLPSGRVTRVASVRLHDHDLAHAPAPRAVTITLDHDIDVARGDTISAPDRRPLVASRVRADVVWLGQQPLREGARVLAKSGPRVTRAIVERIDHRVDLATQQPIAPGDHAPEPRSLAENDVGRIVLRTAAPLVFDPYTDARATGSLILIDEPHHATVAGCMLVGPAEDPS
jgi:sulfate adenylyltransferase subunit 1